MKNMRKHIGTFVLALSVVGMLLPATACATFTGEYSNYVDVNGKENGIDVNVSADADGINVDINHDADAPKDALPSAEPEDLVDEDGMVNVVVTEPYIDYDFRNDYLLTQHYEKHGEEMGFASAEDYEAAAVMVVNNPDVLHKTEKEDGDDVYYLEETNEFVVISTDGYIRTYFCPDAGIDYFNRQ